MVLPNALLAFYYGAKRRADIVYASQVGDGPYLHSALHWNKCDVAAR